MVSSSIYDYQIVLDACAGSTPYSSPHTTTYLAYTFSFNVASLRSASRRLFRSCSSTSSRRAPKISSPANRATSVSEATLTPNDNGQGNEFTLVFPRAPSERSARAVGLPVQEFAHFAGPRDPDADLARTTSLSPSPSPTATSSAAPTNLATTWKFNFLRSTRRPVRSWIRWVRVVRRTRAITRPSSTRRRRARPRSSSRPTSIITGAPNDNAAAIAGGEITTTSERRNDGAQTRVSRINTFAR